MATRIAMITITMRSSMIVKAGVSLLDCLDDRLDVNRCDIAGVGTDSAERQRLDHLNYYQYNNN